MPRNKPFFIAGMLVVMKPDIGVSDEIMIVIEPYWDQTILCHRFSDGEKFCVDPWQLEIRGVVNDSATIEKHIISN